MVGIGTLWGGESASTSHTLSEKDRLGKPPQVLVFTCQYGSGHKMAAQGIVESLPGYAVEVVDIFDDPLRPLDMVRHFSAHHTAASLYNNIAQGEGMSTLNFFGKVVPPLFLKQQKRIEALLAAYLEERKPDLLISCVPLVTPMLLHLSQQRKIPFLVVTTDLDPSGFCYGLQERDIPETAFRMTIAYGPEQWDYLSSVRYAPGVARAFCYHMGYPTRKAFSLDPDPAQLDLLRKEYGIREEDRVVLLLGTRHAVEYAKLFLAFSEEEVERVVGAGKRLYLLCLCGKVSEDSPLLARINQLSTPLSRVQVQAFPGTPRIAELVSLPELCTVISKPGGSTVNEMIKKRKPMLYHLSGAPLSWERGNMEYGEARRLGIRCTAPRNQSLSEKKRVLSLLQKTFSWHREIEEREYPIPEADLDFADQLQRVVAELLHEAAS